MATPHVAGSAALLLQLHPGWTPPEVKSALVSTAGPAWADTARTQEAPVTLEGGGLVALPAATDPRIFTDPVSLSFPDVNVLAGASSSALLVRLTDAGGGAGTWSVGLQSQAATTGASLNIPGTIAVPPGGEADLSVVAQASADAVQGENYGFILLHQGSITRRVPYFFLVDKPALAQDDRAAAEEVPGRRHAHRRQPRQARTAIRPLRSGTHRTRRRCSRTAPRRSTSRR